MNTKSTKSDKKMKFKNSTPEEKFETRNLKDENGSDNFYSFLVIDSAEKWEDACDLHTHYDMPIIGTDRKIRFPLQGISQAEWEQIELKVNVPEWEGPEGEETPEFEEGVERAVLEKKMLLFEAATGQKVPGENTEQKIAFLEDRCPGEVDALFAFISQVLSNFVGGSILDEYNIIRNRSKAEVHEFKSFDDWHKASESKYIFRMQRPFQRHIIEIPLKAIDSSTKNKIFRDTEPPTPPRVPKRLPDGSFNPRETEPNYKDTAWKQRQRACGQRRVVNLLDACLPFLIPGSNDKEKYEWLSRKLVGDVIQLRDFIEDDILGYGSRYDFFTIGSGHQSL